MQSAEDANASPRGLSAPRDRARPWRAAMQFAVIYAIIGAIWIIASDTILGMMISDHDVLNRAQTLKGWTYIGVTAVLLALLVKMYLERLERSQQIVRESEERFQALAKATNDALWDWDLATNVLWWNEGVHTQLGYEPSETGGNIQWWYEKIHPEDRERVIANIHGVIDSGNVVWRDEYRHAKSDGSFAEVHDRGRVIHDSAGKPVRMIGGITDITTRKRAEHELRERFELEQLLLQELDHRVRNNLAALLSLVDLTRRSPTDVHSFAERIDGRVRAMGHVHSLLSDSHWTALGLRSLITAIAPAEFIKRITIEGDEVPIGARQVTGLAMVMHELMTNSVKHGALARPTGPGQPRSDG